MSNPGLQDGTCQTPVWIGIHDCSFNIYSRNEPASPDLERLAEGGINMPLSTLATKPAEQSGTQPWVMLRCAAGILRLSNFRSVHSPINLTFLVMPPWSCVERRLCYQRKPSGFSHYDCPQQWGQQREIFMAWTRLFYSTAVP